MFYRRHKNVSIIYIILPHWHDNRSWNPFSYKTRTCLFYIVNITGDDVLATQGARTSATMILTMLNMNNSVPARWQYLATGFRFCTTFMWFNHRTLWFPPDEKLLGPRLRYLCNMARANIFYLWNLRRVNSIVIVNDFVSMHFLSNVMYMTVLLSSLRSLQFTCSYIWTKYTAMLKCGGLTFDPDFDLDPEAFYAIYSYVYRSHVLKIWMACNKTWTHQCVKIYRAEHWYLNLPRQCLYSPCILTPRDCTNMAAQDRRHTRIFIYIYIWWWTVYISH